MKRVAILLCSSLALSACRDAAAPAIDAARPAFALNRLATWVAITPMAHGPRAAHATATGPDGRIYVFGGLGNTGVLTTSEAYDPDTHSWSDVASPPGGRYLGRAVRGPDGRIYLFGGRTQTGQETSLVQIYDPETDTWADGGSLGTAREWPGVALGPDGFIYIIGGTAGSVGLPSAERYDPVTGTSTPIAPPLVPDRRHPAAATGDDGRIYLIGGAHNNGPYVFEVEVYDPVTNGWTFTTPIPYPAAGLSATSGPEGRIFVIGNQLSFAFEPATGTWLGINSLDDNRFIFWPGATTGLDGNIYVTGGFDDFALEVLDWALSFTAVADPVPVSIDIGPEIIDVSSNGVVPAVLFGSPTYDVSQIDPSTVRLGGAPAVSTTSSDQNGDGFLDMMAEFRISDLTLTAGAHELCMTGHTPLGVPFKGCDTVTVVTNQAPVANAGGPYSGITGTAVTFNASASSDPDGDALTFDWSFGDGTSAANVGAMPSHVYTTAGTFTATVTVSDGKGGSSSASATVTVLSPAGAAEAIGETIDGLVDAGAIPPALAGPLTSSADAAAASLESGNETAATGQIEAFIRQVQAAVKAGRISVEDGAELIAFANRVLDSIGG